MKKITQNLQSMMTSHGFRMHLHRVNQIIFYVDNEIEYIHHYKQSNHG